MSNCYICQAELNEGNKYTEHIILNAIGGKLKSRDIICKECNDTNGDKMDGQLASALNVFSNFFDVDRDRKSPPAIEAIEKDTGSTVFIDTDDTQTIALTKPTVEESGGKVNIHGRFNNKKELKKFLEGVKRKYTELDVDKALSNAEKVSKFIEYEPIEFSVGGPEHFLSILKTAINFYIFKGMPRSEILHLISVLQVGGAEKFVSFSNLDIDTEETAHRIYLKGNKQNKLLFATIDFFSIFSFMVLLNDNYKGDDIEEKYAYDIVNKHEITNEFYANSSASEIKEIFLKHIKDLSVVQARAMGVMGRRQAEKVNNRLIEIQNECFDELRKKHNGEVFTEEIMEDLIECITTKMEPFLKKDIF